MIQTGTSRESVLQVQDAPSKRRTTKRLINSLRAAIKDVQLVPRRCAGPKWRKPSLEAGLGMGKPGWLFGWVGRAKIEPRQTRSRFFCFTVERGIKGLQQLKLGGNSNGYSSAFGLEYLGQLKDCGLKVQSWNTFDGQVSVSGDLGGPVRQWRGPSCWSNMDCLIKTCHDPYKSDHVFF